jgi:hypothetical protein
MQVGVLLLRVVAAHIIRGRLLSFGYVGVSRQGGRCCILASKPQLVSLEPGGSTSFGAVKP